MSERLTTGQLIDKLKLGQVAVCVENGQEDNCKCIKDKIKFENGQLKWVETGRSFYINDFTKQLKWRIVPNYVSFYEAIDALENGKTVYYQGKSNWNDKVTPYDYKYGMLKNLTIANSGFESITKLNWTIEEESN